MNGRLRPVFDRVFAELIEPLLIDPPPGFLGEIYTGIAAHLAEPEEEFTKVDGDIVRVRETITERLLRARTAEGDAELLLAELTSRDFETERHATKALESLVTTLAEFEREDLRGDLIELLHCFVERYSLGYYVGAEGRLYPTLTGVLSRFIQDLRLAVSGDDHTRAILTDFEHALADCVLDPQEARIKTAIQKQVSLVESLCHLHADELGDTLGAMCARADTWPHAKLQESAAAVNKFANNYPGIRHAGAPENKLRDLDARDLVSVSSSLLALVPYLTDQLPADAGVSTIEGDWSELGLRCTAAGWNDPA